LHGDRIKEKGRCLMHILRPLMPNKKENGTNDLSNISILQIYFHLFAFDESKNSKSAKGSFISF